MSPLHERINSLVACVQATGEGTIDLPEMVVDEWRCDSEQWNEILLHIGIAMMNVGIKQVGYEQTDRIGVVIFKVIKTQEQHVREIASMN